MCYYHLSILSCCQTPLGNTPGLEENIAFLLKAMWSKEQKCLELLRENETSIWAGTNQGKRSSHLSKEYAVTHQDLHRAACPSSQGREEVLAVIPLREVLGKSIQEYRRGTDIPC